MLILFGSRFGTTKDTSEKIRDILELREIMVDLKTFFCIRNKNFSHFLSSSNLDLINFKLL